MLAKQCFKCGQTKQRVNFYPHSGMGDGLLGKCKACTKSDVRAHRELNHARVCASREAATIDKAAGKDVEHRARRPRWRGGGAVKERGILFSAPMVRALLAGTKTQTRRLLKHKFNAPESAKFARMHEDHAVFETPWAAVVKAMGWEKIRRLGLA